MAQPKRAVLFVDGNNWYHGLRARGVAHPSRLHWALMSSIGSPDTAPATADEVQNSLREVALRSCPPAGDGAVVAVAGGLDHHRGQQGLTPTNLRPEGFWN